MQYIWSNNFLKVFFSKQEGYFQTFLLYPTDHIGESRFDHGYFTIDVIVSKSKKGMITHTHLVVENPK